jgi:aspartyl-tRNA(Asn)/glutamyl-tRNA(Gln) amidotransferase subunit A
MIGQDANDSTSLAFPETIQVPSGRDLKGVTIGVPRDLMDVDSGFDSGVRSSFEATLKLAESLGATIKPCVLPHAEYGLPAYYVIAPAEASANLARFDGVRYGLRVDGDGDLTTMYSRTRGQGFGPEVKRRIMLGTYALSSGYYDAYYSTAQKVRTLIARDFTAAFADVDLIALPTAPGVAFELGSKGDDPLAMYLNDVWTIPMSLAGLPAISLPSGLSGGLPVGFQLAGPAFSENRLLEVAYALEQSIGFDGRPARDGGTR